MPPSLAVPPTQDRIDWLIIVVILAVVGIVFVEACLVLWCIRFFSNRGQRRWARLREEGEVIVDGPALIWTSDLPPQQTVSTFNLRQIPPLNRNIETLR